MKRYLLILAGLLALVATACAPQVDVEAEKAAIEKMFADWLEVTSQGGEAGADGYATFVTEDAVFLPPNAVRVDGRAGVRELILEFTLAEDFSITWNATSIEVTADGKLAYAIGMFEYSLKDAAGNLISDRGKFVDVLKKQTDGSWKCSVGMWSSDLPEEPSDPLVGVWLVATLTTPDRETIDPAGPGQFIFANGRYSAVYSLGAEERPHAAAGFNPTADEKVTQYDTIIVNSGIYEVNGSELTLRPIVAKTPEYAGGSSTMEFRIDGDILTTTMRSITSVDGASPEGAIGSSMTLRRVQ